jgi:hypothetical protein
MSDCLAMLSLLFLIIGAVLFLLGLAQVFIDTGWQIPAFVLFAGAAFFGLLAKLMITRSSSQ